MGTPEGCVRGGDDHPRFAAWFIRSITIAIMPLLSQAATPLAQECRRNVPHSRGEGMPYSVPPLPYDYAALEPHIDEQTMRIHHAKHHQAYVDRVNAALEGTQWADLPIEDVIRDLQQIPEDKRTVVRNHGGGHLNHTLFWTFMSPQGG